MALPAYDSSTLSGSSTVNYTFSHTTSGADRYLFVICSCQSTPPSAVSYAGVSMTLLANLPTNVNVWGLASPASGANNVSVTVGSAFSTRAIAASYNGVSGIGNPDASHQTDTGGAAVTVTDTITTVTDNSYVIGFGTYGSSSGQLTAGSGATERQNSGASSSYTSFGVFDSNGVKTPAGTRSMTLNVSSSSGRMVLQQYALKPAVPNLAGLLMALM